MSRPRPLLVIAAVGVLTFAVVFTLLEFSPSSAAPGRGQPTPMVAPALAPTLAPDSLAAHVTTDDLAVGVPVAGSEALLRDLQAGDRLDILASLGQAQPVTAVVVHGATVLRAPTESDPLIVDVSSADAMALAHLVLSGTHLGYIVWPANAEDPAVEPRVLDERTARSLLGLSVPATPTLAPPVTPAPAPSLVGPPTDRSGFLYQVQPGDSWPSIAATFGMSVLQLEVWNEITPDDDPVPGRLVFIPRAS